MRGAPIESLEPRRLLASIGGTVFIDTDKDGARDTGEAAAAGRTVYIDQNNNAKLDSTEKKATTSSTGTYSLTGVAAGTHKVRQVLASGFIQTSPANGFGLNVTVSATQTKTGQNFGTVQSTVSPPPSGSGAKIRGNVFGDTDRDGARDTGESGLTGRTVYIDANNNGRLDTGEKTAATNTFGDYEFANLAAGTHKVRQILTAGAQQTSPANGYGQNVAVSSTQTKSGIDFGATVATSNDPLTTSLARVFAYAVTAMTRTMNDIGNNANTFVERTRTDGTWKTVNAAHWTAGFLAGTMWQIYNFVGNSAWRLNATKWTTPLASQVNQTGDLAFKFMTSYLPLYQSSNDPAHMNVLLAAAASKNAQWNSTVGAFRTTWFTTRSGNPRANFAVLMDMTTDMELLMWAGKQTNNQQYIDRAIAHTQKVIANQVRADGSISQFGMYDAANGEFVMQETYQGYSNASTWSRGQAWAILSFTAMARETGRSDFAAAAQKVADYFINNLPADSVPYWDFNHPDIPSTYRDSSAAAIAASGLLELSQVLTNAVDAARYRAAAERILTSLISPSYWAEGTIHRGLLQHGAVNIPNDEFGRDNSIIYGDYYFLKAMNQWRAITGG
jgi:unsaturated chondroitin disaccharide hydrolase